MNKTLIHFSGDDYWNSNPHSRFHITNAFYNKGYKILWINPIGHRFPSYKKKGFLGRIFRKLKSIIILIRSIDCYYYIFTPILIPILRNGIFRSINKITLKFQLLIIGKLLGFKNPVLFITSPIFGDIVNIISYTKAIYYYSDKYIAYSELTRENKDLMMELDQKLVCNVDLICCATKMIYNEVIQKSKKNVLYIPHVVDFPYFQKALLDKNNTNELQTISRPIIGYYGAITKAIDWEIIEYCATNRPEYNFVFIGRDESNHANAKGLKNVHRIGKKSFKDIPYYGKEFDVCIVPFIRDLWIVNSSPLKIKEYLSLEKPVVSTYIEEIETLYNGIVYMSKTKEQFLWNIDIALTNDKNERILKGLNLVKNKSWNDVLLKIENHLYN